jgi:NADPH-dependent 2,4-dienoyl-CoA reductase/sulfur reductase-like enzyme
MSAFAALHPGNHMSLKTKEEQMQQSSNGRVQILEGKVAVVTGAAGGIGRAVAMALAQNGACVVGIDICATVDPNSGVTPATREELEETGRLIETVGNRWRSVVLDQRDFVACERRRVRSNANSAASTSCARMPEFRHSSLCWRWRIQIGTSRLTSI